MSETPSGQEVSFETGSAEKFNYNTVLCDLADIWERPEPIVLALSPVDGGSQSLPGPRVPAAALLNALESLLDPAHLVFVPDSHACSNDSGSQP